MMLRLGGWRPDNRFAADRAGSRPSRQPSLQPLWKELWRSVSLRNGFVGLFLFVCACGPASGPKSTAGQSATTIEVAKSSTTDKADAGNAALPPAGPAPDLLFPLNAGGSEPPWSAQMDGTGLILNRPGLRSIQAALGPPQKSTNMTQLMGLGPNSDLSVTLFARECLGGDADAQQSFPLSIKIAQGDLVYEGCAWHPAQTGPADEDDLAQGNLGWASQLENLLPVISLCAARAASQPVRILHAQGRDVTIVRVEDGSGERFECTVKAGDAVVTRFEPLGSRDFVPGESDPVFTPQGSAPPRGRCNETIEAKDSGGRVVGNITFSRCG